MTTPYSIGAQRESRHGTPGKPQWTPTTDRMAALGIAGTTEGLLIHVHVAGGQKHALRFDWDAAQTITSIIRNARRHK